MGDRGEQQGEQSRQEMTEERTRAGMRNAQNLYLFRRWSQEDLLIDKEGS